MVGRWPGYDVAGPDVTLELYRSFLALGNAAGLITHCSRAGGNRPVAPSAAFARQGPWPMQARTRRVSLSLVLPTSSLLPYSIAAAAPPPPKLRAQCPATIGLYNVALPRELPARYLLSPSRQTCGEHGPCQGCHTGTLRLPPVRVSTPSQFPQQLPLTDDYLRLHAKDGGPAAEVLAAHGKGNLTTDKWLNVPPSILANLPRKLHLRKDHPLSITRQLIESRFPGYRYYNDLSPIVTAAQNFDSLSIPQGHVSRNRTDTYYFNKNTLLRTHTSAHQADVFRANETDGFLISADVYRRDEVDRSHYPIFHQMEGAHTWDRAKYDGNVAKAVWDAVSQLPQHDIKVEDPNPTVHPERNPLQPEHSIEEVEAISTHLKKSLENVVVEIFSKAKEAAIAAGDTSASTSAPLRVRWVEAYFPFTSPSWELEVFWQDDWLEVLGCGVVRQSLPQNAGVPSRIGWAFGLGLDRIAMLLFNIPDIRLFWSHDLRFLSQFAEGRPFKRFAPFSRYPECYKDVSFWLPEPASKAADATAAEASYGFHENDVMEIVRNVAGDIVEDVRFVDEFTHPKTKRESKCYRINYRSLERTLKNEEVNELHATICAKMVEDLGVVIR